MTGTLPRPLTHWLPQFREKRGDWDEADHPRDHGEFSSSGGDAGDGRMGATKPGNRAEDREGRAKSRLIASYGRKAVAASKRAAASAVHTLVDLHGKLIAAGAEPGDVLDDVQDWALPWKGAVAKGLDPVAQGLGVGAWELTVLAPRVTAFAVVRCRRWLRSRAAERAKALAGGSVRAEAVAALLAAIGEAIGVPEELRVTAADVAKRHREKGVSGLREKAAHKFGTTHVELTGPVAERLRQLGRLVRDEDLADDGREDLPHVTVRYGLHQEVTSEDVGRSVAGCCDWVRLRLGHVTTFPASEGRDFDVLMVHVESDDLRRLNRRLAQLPHTDTFPEYKPHCTIAYVRAGLGDGYARRLGELNEVYGTDRITFSDADRRETVVRLCPQAAECSPPVAPVAWSLKSAAAPVLLRLKSTDAAGHEHADDGRFTGPGGSGKAAGDRPKRGVHDPALRGEARAAAEAMAATPEAARFGAAVARAEEVLRSARGTRKERLAAYKAARPGLVRELAAELAGGLAGAAEAIATETGKPVARVRAKLDRVALRLANDTVPSLSDARDELEREWEERPVDFGGGSVAQVVDLIGGDLGATLGGHAGAAAVEAALLGAALPDDVRTAVYMLEPWEGRLPPAVHGLDVPIPAPRAKTLPWSLARSARPATLRLKSFAWDESVHPRGDDGRFVGRSDLAAARRDPEAADRLRERVTNPAQRAKLDVFLKREVKRPRKGSGEKRAGQLAARRRGQAVVAKALRDPADLTPKELGDLHAHLSSLTAGEVRQLKRQLAVRGGRLKGEVVERVREAMVGRHGRELARRDLADRDEALAAATRKPTPAEDPDDAHVQERRAAAGAMLERADAWAAAKPDDMAARAYLARARARLARARGEDEGEGPGPANPVRRLPAPGKVAASGGAGRGGQPPAAEDGPEAGDDYEPPPRYPSRVHPELDYMNEDDRDSDDRWFRQQQRRRDRAAREEASIRERLTRLVAARAADEGRRTAAAAALPEARRRVEEANARVAAATAKLEEIKAREAELKKQLGRKRRKGGAP